jgi:fibronectin type 3 domain-containing protein
LSLGDDQNSGYIDIGFPFPFYNGLYTQIAICSNGWASFTDPFGTYNWASKIPDTRNPNALLSPFWMDLDLRTTGKVYYKHFNVTSPKHFVVTWDNATEFGSSLYNQTFQIVLFENGTILFQYKIVNLPPATTPIVGIENGDGTIGTSYSYSALKDNTTIKFYYNYPDHDIRVTSFPLSNWGMYNQDMTLTAYVANFGLKNETNVNVTLKVNNQLINWTGPTLSIPSFTQKEVKFIWRPTLKGNYTVTITVEQVPGETITNNNQLMRLIDIRNWRGVVLFDRTHGGWMDYSRYQTWFDEVRKINIIVDEYTTGPINSVVLADYDVFMVPYSTYSFTSNEINDIHNFINDGNGLLVIGEDWNGYYNSLTSPFEISWQSISTMGGTSRDIRPHEITTGVSSVYLNWRDDDLEVTGSAKGLLWDTNTPKNLVLAISNESAPGRVACYTDPYGFEEWDINTANNKLLAKQIMDWVIGDFISPKRPTGFTAINGKVGNQVNLSWNKNNERDLNGYHIYRRTASETYDLNSPAGVAGANDSSYKDTGVEDHTEYFYALAAIDEVPNISPLSAEKKVTPTDIIPPKTPRNFSVTDVGTGFELKISWNFNDDSDLEAYHVYKSASMDGPFGVPYAVVPSTQNYYLDTDVIESELYHYRISAIDEVPNEAPLSIIKSNRPYDRLPPAQVVGFNVTNPGIGNTLVIRWEDNQEVDLVDYLIERRDNKGNIKKTLIYAPANSYNDTGLVDGNAYYYRITAGDDSKLIPPDRSPNTQWIKGVSTDITPPDIPVNLSVTDESYITKTERIHCLNISWAKSNDSDIRGYLIYRDEFPMFTITEKRFVAKIDVEEYYHDYDVFEGVKYFYKVIAFDEVPNESPASAEISGIPRDITPPAIPSHFKAEPLPEGNAVRLTWDLQVEPDIAGYRLYCTMNESGDFELVKEFDQTEHTYKHIGLIDDQIYFYKLQAFDQTPNYSPFTSIISTTPSDMQPPHPPKGLRIVTIDTGSTLSLSWRANDDEDINGYRIYRRSEDSPFTMVMAVDKNTTDVLDTFLVDGVQYRYYITAIDEVPNESEPSATKDGMSKDGEAPAPPTELVAEISSDKKSVALTWTGSNTSDVEGYRIFRSTDAKTFKKLIDIPFTQITYLDTDVEYGKEYYYQVASLDEVPNISPRTKSVKIKVPEEESALDISTIVNIGAILIVVIIVLVLIFFIFIGKKRSKKAGAEKDVESRRPEKPQLPFATSIPGMPPSMQGPGTGPYPPGPQAPMTPVMARTSYIQPSMQPQPTLRSEPLKAAPSLLPTKPSAVPRLPPASETEEEEKSAAMGPATAKEPMLVHEPESIKVMDHEPTIETIEPDQTVQPKPQQELEPSPPESIIPRELIQITPIAPPKTVLPTILIPVDEDETDSTGKEKKRKHETFTNPLITDAPKRILRKPPEGKVVKKDKR